ncbi:MAG: RNA 3'-terminal phosphate cyclase [Anaerolineales bacterium]|nr:RNA 3'-terminal phosphate cyclase [Chloroflexota bacterium]MBL6983958.1 RNA 3'-terminal phosphate cyclase [Anaerolineales bacterium]
MIEIDGSIGEGGGQVLRSSLTLSVMTGQPLHISNIRAKRKKPGLRAQHLQAVRAASAICGASVSEAQIGSAELIFDPGEIIGGKYHFDIGTAGSTSLVLQTILLPLARAKRASTVTITGGTHVQWSPCFHYLDWHWLLYLRQMGVESELVMDHAGFYPQGGGRIRARIQPKELLQPLNLTERGAVRQIRGISATANLPRDIAKRQRQRVVSRLGSKYPLNDIRIVQFPARVKGTVIILLAEFEYSQCCYFALGAPGKRADLVADEVVDAIEEFMASDGAIDQYLADQILLPLSFADGPSRLHTSKITQHLLTNAEVIQAFLPTEIKVHAQLGESGIVEIIPRKITTDK